jgi:TM2 domain-containing membrane protein YozV
MSIGTVGGIVGIVLGCAGGLLGAFCSYKAAKGPRERRFVIWASVGIFVSVFLFLALLSLLSGWRVWIWTCYLVLLPLVLRYLNRWQTAIQREEQTR